MSRELLFKGARQDSGDPEEFIKTMRRFYDEQGIKEKTIIVFSDSLDVESCKKYKAIADKAGFETSFGVGTYFTSELLIRVSKVRT
ncbi:nicotinate phosphoribosyltransferase [Rhizina undulata]